MPRTIKTVITALLCLSTTLPAGAAVISYTAATVGLTANIVGTGSHDEATTSSSPTTVTASYNPPGEGAPSGNASASITTLTQSLNGFHMQGSSFGSSTAGSSSGLEVNGGVTPSSYYFTIADPTWVTLDVNITRNLSGFWGGSGGLRVGICASSGPAPRLGSAA